MSLEIFQTLETPVPIFKTYLGNLLYTTPDLAEEISSTASVVLGQVDIQDVYCRDFNDIPIGKIQYQHNLNREVKDGEAPLGLRVDILSSRQKGQPGMKVRIKS
jgi:hypothetical protein